MDKVQELKERLISAARLAEKDGLCRHKSGNFSICIRDENKVLITPSEISRDVLEPEDVIAVDLDGNIIENRNRRKPSRELRMHIEIYKAREDVSAVVHTHSIYATAFAVKGIAISPILAEAEFYGGKVEIASFAEPGSAELAKNAAEAIKKADVCLLKNHGVITVADTIENALLKACYVEDAAQIEAISKFL